MSHSSSSVSGLRLSLRTASPPANPPSTSTPLPSARMYSLYLFYEKTCKINTSCTGIACTRKCPRQSGKLASAGRGKTLFGVHAKPQKKGHKKKVTKEKLKRKASQPHNCIVYIAIRKVAGRLAILKLWIIHSTIFGDY